MNPVTLTHKIRLSPTHKQAKYFRQACGVARFTWNWALAQWKKQYEAGKKPSALSLKGEFNAIKPIEFPWMYDVTKYASQQPFIFLQTAFRAFFHKKAKYPQFKKNFSAIAIEDLNVKGMMSNHYLARSIADMGFFEFRRQLGYKAKIGGSYIKIADRWFPSTKQCCRCKTINDSITLSDRTFKCNHCGLEIDRELNAAINLKSTVSSTGFQACGEKSAGSSESLSETGLYEAGTKPCTDMYTF